jgi:glycosyltransferase involved in cell wall biosynthesis
MIEVCNKVKYSLAYYYLYAVKEYKFAYVSSVDPRDKRSWSGTHHSILNAIDGKLGKVDILGPYEPKLTGLIGKVKTGLSQKLSGKRIDYRHSHMLSKSYARYFEKKLNEKQYDFIIAPAASCEIAHLNTKIPIIYISDTTFKRSLGYHKALTNLTKKSEVEADEIEKMALKKSHTIIVSSVWAADSVIQDYRIPKEKVHVIPFGPNMENLPGRSNLKSTLNVNQIELLFPAVYWENKGGDITVNCLNALKQNNISARLTVVGCNPPIEHQGNSSLEVYSYLNKNDSVQLKKLQELFLRADFLILPTRFDCTPVVFCEASAFGLPSLCSDTGGVRGHIFEGENGFLIDYHDKGEGYAKKIMEIISKPNNFIKLRKSSRELFEKKLNWNHWIEEFKKIINY